MIIVITIMSHRNDVSQQVLTVCRKSLVLLGWLVLGYTLGVCDVRTWNSDATMSFKSFMAHLYA